MKGKFFFSILIKKFLIPGLFLLFFFPTANIFAITSPPALNSAQPNIVSQIISNLGENLIYAGNTIYNFFQESFSFFKTPTLVAPAVSEKTIVSKVPVSPVVVIGNPVSKNSEVSETEVFSTMEKLLKNPAVLAQLRGPVGPTGPAGSVGVSGVTNSTGEVFNNVTPYPAAYYYGATYFPVSTSIFNAFSTNTASIGNLNVSGDTNLTGNLNVTGTITGNINASLNGVSLTAKPVGFQITGGTTAKTLTVNNSLTLSGTDGATLNIGAGGTLGTAAFTSATDYLLATGTTAGATAQAQVFTKGIITGLIYPAVDSTTAFQINKADGVTNIFNVDTTNGRVGIGTNTPKGLLDVVGSSNSTSTAFTGARAMSIINTDTTNGNMAGFDFRTNDLAGTLTTGGKILTIFNSHVAGAVSADMTFRTNNAGTMGEVMRLTSSGNIGIGTTNPTAQLSQKSTTAMENPTYGPELTTSSDSISGLGSDWAGDYTNGFTHTATGTTSLVDTTFVPTPGTVYRVTTTVTNYTAGSFRVSLGGGGNNVNYAAPGIYYFDVSSSDTTLLTFVPTAAFAGTITFSIKQINPAGSLADFTDSTGAISNQIHFSLASNSNMYYGVGSGQYNTTGGQNTAFGYGALNSITSGGGNTAIGYQAMYNSSAVAQLSVAIGDKALYSNTTGINNIAIGYKALYSSTTASSNMALGYSALAFNTTGSGNAALGFQALFSNTTGNFNVANGQLALSANITGNNNTANGYQALYRNTVGNNNTVNGYNSLSDLGRSQSATTLVAGVSYTIASLNTTDFTLIGASSNTVGTVFTATGPGAGTGTASPNSATDNNTVLGYNTGLGIVYGANNTILGANVTGLASNLSNNIIIADGSGNQRINVNALGNVGINNPNPNYGLDVSGNVNAQGLLINGVPINTTAPSNVVTYPAGSFFFSNSGAAILNNTTHYLMAAGVASPTTDLGGYLVSTAGTLTSLYVKADSNTFTTATSTFTVMVNKVATSMVCVANAGVLNCTDTAHPTTVSVGDRISIKLVTSSGGGGSLVTPMASVAFSTTTNVFNGAQWTGTGSDIYYNTGKVGIGIISPANILHVTGTPVANTAVAQIANTLGGTTQNNGLLILAGNNTGVSASQMITFERTDATVIGSISQNTAATVAFNTSSDQRTKENIIPTTYGLTDLMKINVADFNFTNDSNKQKVTGFIAQNLYTVFPEAVTTNGDTGTETLAPGATPWMVDYSKVTPLIVKAVQDLNLNLESVSGTIIPIAGSENETFVANFFKGIENKLTTWLADTMNGIGEVFAGTFRAKEALCINNTCVTEAQLQTLLQNAGMTGTPPSATPAPVTATTTPDPSGLPIPTATTTPDTTATTTPNL